MDLKLTGEGFSRSVTIEGGDFAFDASLRTAVIMSLIVNGRASEGELPEDRNPQGWWANPVGSKIWLLHQDKIVPSTLLKVEAYCREALQWLYDLPSGQNPASSIDITAFRCSTTGIGVDIIIHRSDGSDEVFAFANLWDEIRNATDPIPRVIPGPIGQGDLLLAQDGAVLTTEGGDLLEWR